MSIGEPQVRESSIKSVSLQTTNPRAAPSATELARLVALESYDILDTPVAEIFDDFAREPPVREKYAA
jgi:hypothetical protein